MVSSFPEYVAHQHEQMSLHLLITIEPWSACETLMKRLSLSEFCQELSGDDFQKLVVMRAAAEADIDAVIQQAVTFIRIFNRSQQQAFADIVEARLCPSLSNQRAIEPVILSDRFAVCFARNGEVTGRECIMMDAGQAFGSGRHPSTKLGVKVLEYLADHETSFPRNVLDLGCGSGILSFICARLGASSMLGIDISKEAVASAGRNCEMNGFGDVVTFRQAEPFEMTSDFELLVANLSPSVLMQLIPLLGGLSQPEAPVVLAGLQTGQSAAICREMEKEGFTGPRVTFADGPWRAHLFYKQ